MVAGEGKVVHADGKRKIKPPGRLHGGRDKELSPIDPQYIIQRADSGKPETNNITRGNRKGGVQW